MRKSRKKIGKKQKYDKIVIMVTSLAAILIISVLGFQASGELSSAGSGFMFLTGAAFTLPVLVSILLLSFLLLKIRN